MGKVSKLAVPVSRVETSRTASEEQQPQHSSENAIGLWQSDWQDVPLRKQLLLGIAFAAAFLLLDGSATASQWWEGSPPWYLPVGLSLALLLGTGRRYVITVFAASILGAVVNYHRPIFSWSGLPGAIAVYLGYVGTASALRGRWRVDLRLRTGRDVGRYILSGFGGAIFSAIAGMFCLLGDGKIHRSDAVWTVADWWASDALAIVVFTPFLLLHILPIVDNWLKSNKTLTSATVSRNALSPAEIMELIAQCCVAVFAIWFVFCYPPAAPYQPLYLLFIPVIWVAVRKGLPGAVFTTFAIGIGMTVAAYLTKTHRSVPRIQLATLALGLTGMCLGAVVSERKRSERSLRESEKRYRLLFERSLAGVFRTTLDGRIIECNPAAAQMFGYTPDEILAVSMLDLYYSNSDREIFLAKVKSRKSVTNHEMKFRRKNGESVWVMVNVTLVEDDFGVPSVVEGSLVDITERKAAEKRIQSLAYYDALTGLPNRILLRDRLSQALRAARRQQQQVAVFFLDLDRFKVINDSLGHSVGDVLLQEVAARLRTFVREADTVARLGGDEFVIVVNGVRDICDVAIAAERFMDAMSAAFVVQGNRLNIGCSIGISVFPEHGTESENLIELADAAMYNAKESGRNNFQVFTADMRAKAVERLTLESGLRLALEKKELFLVYQPQVDIATGNISGMESLLRWKHPKLGLVPPDRFIRIAENSGLILPIGEWVLETACSHLRQLQDEGLPIVPVAVNVSAVQFRHKTFCELIRRVLRDTRLDPKYLELELTESLLLAHADVTLAVLQELKSMGIKLAIDDFGTGYSSLNYLKRFPVSKLKIDRSFVRDVAISSDDAAITTAIISMAKSLNLKVIGEGVETQAQMSFLDEHSCDGIQGYYFSRPLSIEQLADKLRAHSPKEYLRTKNGADNSAVATMAAPEGCGFQANKAMTKK